MPHTPKMSAYFFRMRVYKDMFELEPTKENQLELLKKAREDGFTVHKLNPINFTHFILVTVCQILKVF